MKHNTNINRESIQNVYKELYDIATATLSEVMNVSGLNLSLQQLKAILYFLENKITNEMINELRERQQQFYINRENEHSVDKSKEEILEEMSDVVNGIILLCESGIITNSRE